MFTHAIARTPSASFARGLTTVALGAPAPEAMLAQHAAYLRALEALELEVQCLPPIESYPDAHYVEDVAIVLPELAVITRPGAPERRGEEQAIVEALAKHRPLVALEAPGTLDGGDVLVVGREVLIGLSSRTNAAGATQLARLLAARGYRCASVPVESGLHLKSSVTALAGRTLLATATLARQDPLRGFECVVVEAGDEYSANVLEVNGTILLAAGYPRTREKIARIGLPIVELEMSEARKLDGGLTCLSLRF